MCCRLRTKEIDHHLLCKLPKNRSHPNAYKGPERIIFIFLEHRSISLKATLHQTFTIFFEIQKSCYEDSSCSSQQPSKCIPLNTLHSSKEKERGKNNHRIESDKLHKLIIKGLLKSIKNRLQCLEKIDSQKIKAESFQDSCRTFTMKIIEC